MELPKRDERHSAPGPVRAPSRSVSARTAKRRAPLYIVPNMPELWEAFGRFFDARQVPRPVPSEDVLLVADARGLIAGVCLYPCRGPFVIVEHLSTNPGAPARLRHRAVTLLVTLVKTYAATKARYPIVVVRKPSLVRLLAKNGFLSQQAVVMTCNPTYEVR